MSYFWSVYVYKTKRTMSWATILIVSGGKKSKAWNKNNLRKTFKPIQVKHNKFLTTHLGIISHFKFRNVFNKSFLSFNVKQLFTEYFQHATRLFTLIFISRNWKGNKEKGESLRRIHLYIITGKGKTMNNNKKKNNNL